MLTLPMRARIGLVVVACVVTGLVACANGRPADATGADATFLDSGRGDATIRDGGGGDSGSRVDAFVGNGDAALRDAALVLADAGRDAAVSTATPTAACGDDLDVINGAVVPDYGAALILTQSTSGDLANLGTLPRTASEHMVALSDGTRSYADTSVSITAGTLPATAYVPNSAGPYPLVVVLPGFQANRTLYATFLDHFASWGFVAVGIDTRSDAFTASHDKEALELSQSIDWLLTQAPFKDRIDASKIVVAGHSKGGKVAFFAAALDPRIDIVIGWDPVNSGGPPCFVDPMACNRLPVAPNCPAMNSGVEHLMHAETLVIGAPPDPLVAPDPHHNCIHFYRGAPSPAWLAVLNVGHVAWAANNDAEDIRITKRIQLALLLTRFYGATGLASNLPGGSGLTGNALVMTHTRK